jgi:ubiquinone/menaquinone biosynthesis C-methylase UbiE
MTVDYNRLAARFDERYQHLTYSGIHSQLLELIDRPGLKVLEVGCGTGHWLAVLDGHAAYVVGADTSSGMLAKARCQAPAAGLVCASAELLPFSGHSMDLIFCVNAFHHFSDPKRFLQNARSLLRKSGRLAIFGLDPHEPEEKWYFYDYFPGLREIDLKRFVPHKEIVSMMTEAGFHNAFSRPAERIQKTYFGEEVLADPFLDRASTSQLLLISEKAYIQGKEAIIFRLQSAGERKSGCLSFIIDHHLFATIGTRND